MFDDDRWDWDPEPDRHTPWEPPVALPPAPQEPLDDDLGPADCRGTWRGRLCTEPATRHGYCDFHLEKD